MFNATKLLSFTSNLPIIELNTLGQTIVDDPRIVINFGLINNTSALNTSGGAYQYFGKIEIEIRGSSSSGFPKVPYGFATLQNDGITFRDTSLLGLPSEHDFILYSPYSEKTHMHNPLTYQMMRSMGWYAPRCRFVELVINGDYQGIYVMMEKIKRDKNRVDVSKMATTSVSGDLLTGGYIVKVDKITGAPAWDWNTPFGSVYVQTEYPKYGDIQPAQLAYIKAYVDSFDTALFGPSFTDPVSGYRRFVNINSFIDEFIIYELANNIDGYRLSAFFNKDKASKCGKLVYEPSWDFNLAYGNGDYCNGEAYNDWQLFAGCGTDGSGYWINKMTTDPWFVNQLHCRWISLRSGALSNTKVLGAIDSMYTLLTVNGAASRDSAQWNVLGSYVWPNSPYYSVPNDYKEVVDSMKSWISKRLTWMDANMLGSSACAPSTTQVSISEVSYNHDASLNSGDWIELHNYGATAINVSGWSIYDPFNAHNVCVLNAPPIPAGGYLVVCESVSAFASVFPLVTNRTGPLCFKLNNDAQTIQLKNANGKIVRSFAYDDDAPWPVCPDDCGRTLSLINDAANPTLPSSWTQGCIPGSPGSANITTCVESVLINEINYNSSPANDAGDWLELYNKSSSNIVLTGWSVTDGAGGVFNFPSGTSLPPASYLVVFGNLGLFNSQHPTVANKVGAMPYTLSNSGGKIKLLNASGKLVQAIKYDDNLPWNTNADGNNYTLQTISTAGAQCDIANWTSICPEGSPGMVNVTGFNPTIVGSSIVCNSQTITYNVAATAGSNYIWTVTGGTILSGGGILDATITIQWGGTGAGTVSVIQTTP